MTLFHTINVQPWPRRERPPEQWGDRSWLSERVIGRLKRRDEMLSLASQGESASAIAKRLGVSDRTIYCDLRRG